VTLSRRLATIAALLRRQVARGLDDAAEMFVRLTTRMHNRAKEALDEHRTRHAEETDALVALLRETVLACQDQEAERDARLAPVEVDRRHFEVCLFTQVVNELKSGDLYIPGSDEYGDYRDQLITWEEYQRDIKGYAERAGVPANAGAFVAALKARLTGTADAIDRAFPENEHVEIVNGEPVVKRLRAQDAVDGTAFLERLLKARMAPVGVLEALVDTEHWLGWTRHFGPVSGLETKLDRPRERYLATTFCYGCVLGPSQAARSLKGLDRRHIAFVNQRHVTEESLDDAITGVIDAYAQVGLHRHWGDGSSASADGMKWDMHPESLKSSYHIRYGGYGGIGYYLVSDTYIALFSRFLACGAYEGHSILDFVAENRSLL